MHSQIGKIFSKINDRLILFRDIHPFVKKNQTRSISEDNTICLFCQPRGGSTWLSEILLHTPNTVLIDEPLWRGQVSAPFAKPDYYKRKVKKIADLNFFYNQSIPEEIEWPEAQAAFEEILAGRSISIGLYDEQDLKRLRKGTVYITKFNYANLLAPWLIRHFECKAIVLTRHPCAVIASQLKLPAWKNIDCKQAESSTSLLHHEQFSTALDIVGQIDSREKYLALIWALGFKNTAMHRNNNTKWLTVSYESLLINTKEEISRIDQRFSTGLADLNIDYGRPSKSTRFDSAKNLEDNAQLTSWKRNLSARQIATILDVLEKLEIEIYTDKVEPSYDRLYAKSPSA